MKTLRDLFRYELCNLYQAESILKRKLPVLIKHAHSASLKKKLEHERLEVDKDIANIQTLAKKCNFSLDCADTNCEGMQGLAQELDAFLEASESQPVTEAAIILEFQKMKHYEICAYGTLASYAKILGYTDVLEHLKICIKHEKESDAAFTQCAMKDINKKAACSEN